MGDFPVLAVTRVETSKETSSLLVATRDATPMRIVLRDATPMRIVLITCLGMSSWLVFAEPGMVPFDIPRQAAEKALNELAVQANVPMLFISEEVRGITTRRVVGEFELLEAVTLLLADTGLTGNLNDSGVLSITRAPDAAADGDSGSKGTGSMNNKSFFGRTAAALAGVFLSGSGVAESTSGSSVKKETKGMEEIVVTAQRREQSVLEVPMAVTVVNGESIRLKGARNITDLMGAIPGFSYANSSQSDYDNVVYVMRGVAPPGGEGASLVGVYFNEIPVNPEATSALPLAMPFFDMDRVEVLRGPQGTLYGDGSPTGVIRNITRMPTPGSLDGELEISSGSVDGGDTGFRIAGAGNLPIDSDTFAVRLAGYTQETPGYIDSSRGFGNDINDTEDWGARVSAVYQASDKVAVEFIYQHFEAEKNGHHNSNKDYVTNFFQPDPASSLEYDIVNVEVLADLGFADLRSSTAWLDRENYLTFPLYGVLDFLGPDTYFYVPTQGEIFYQEFRLSSKGDSDNFWQVGISYKRADDDRGEDSRGPEFISALGGFLNSEPLLFQADASEVKATAIYGDYTFTLGDEWELTVGGRYYEDERDRTSLTTSWGGAFDPVTFAPVYDTGVQSRSVDNDKFTGRTSLQWNYKDHQMVYVSAAQGFRSGGIQRFAFPLPDGIPEAFGPEELTTFELGFKGTALDNRLSYEIAFYTSDYQDIQVLKPNSFNVQAFTNGGEAEMDGFEIVGLWRPIAGLSIEATFSDVNHEYTKIDDGAHKKGDPMDNVPDNVYSFSVDYRWALPRGFEGHVRADFRHTDEFRGASVLQDPPSGASEDQSILNARVGISNDRWSAHFFAENLNNEDRQAYPSLGGGADAVYTRPRTLGLAARMTF